MNNVRKSFLLYSMLAIFALLTVMLSIINGVNFTMASSDADIITQMLSERHGFFPEKKNSDFAFKPRIYSSEERMGPMGPESPEVNSSLRYFTFSFNKNNKPKKIAFHISAVDEEEAEQWAASLINEDIGWTRGTYRYRVYEEGEKTFVTVIDQGRELLPSYRILVISVCGEIMGLIISFAVLRIVGKRLFKPLEEADYKQKKFIANIENEFKLPLTIINANTELIEKESGPSDNTASINRQVKKMIALVKEIGSLAIFESENPAVTKVNLSSTLSALAEYSKSRFEEKGISLDYDIEDNIIIDGEEENLKRMLSELIENAVKYSLGEAHFTLKKEKDRVLLTQSNDTSLSADSIEQIFDRFTTLENADNTDSVGLGLSYVKDIVTSHNGRVSAKVKDGMFMLTIAL